MKRVEFLLITLMALCVFTLISACGKSDKSAGEPAYPNPDVTYAYNQRPCSEEIIYEYEQVVRACDHSRSRRDYRRERRNCVAHAEAFLAQYPQINCTIEARAGYSSRYKYKTISEERVRRKMND